MEETSSLRFEHGHAKCSSRSLVLGLAGPLTVGTKTTKSIKNTAFSRYYPIIYPCQEGEAETSAMGSSAVKRKLNQESQMTASVSPADFCWMFVSP